MNPNLLDDRYKHNLFIYHYNYNYFQIFHAHRNEIINYKNFYLLIFLKWAIFIYKMIFKFKRL